MTSTPDITKAASILREGGLVAFPTETVYGLGADARNELAMRRIFEAKGRPFDHPLIVHIAHIKHLSDWAREVPEAALKLAEAFWPGPLTMIFKKQPNVPDIVTGGQDTIGLRIPRHPVAQALLQAYWGGIAAPSANRFTHISPTTAAAVQEELGKKVDLILDGGACEIGLESTIIDMTQEHPVILRPGMISAQAIGAVLGFPVSIVRQDTPVVRAPGMHHLHYAPMTRTALIDTQEISPMLRALDTKELPMVFVIHSDAASPQIDHVNWVKMPSDPAGYAHDLYRTLRVLDNEHFKRIMIERVPEGPEWEAIRDRLLKACGDTENTVDRGAPLSAQDATGKI